MSLCLRYRCINIINSFETRPEQTSTFNATPSSVRAHKYTHINTSTHLCVCITAYIYLRKHPSLSACINNGRRPYRKQVPQAERHIDVHTYVYVYCYVRSRRQTAQCAQNRLLNCIVVSLICRHNKLRACVICLDLLNWIFFVKLYAAAKRNVIRWSLPSPLDIYIRVSVISKLIFFWPTPPEVSTQI